MTSKLTYSNSGLVGGSNWTNVSLLNAALAHESLAAIHNRKALAASSVRTKARQRARPAIDLNPDLATASTWQSAA